MSVVEYACRIERFTSSRVMVLVSLCALKRSIRR